MFIVILHYFLFVRFFFLVQNLLLTHTVPNVILYTRVDTQTSFLFSAALLPVLKPAAVYIIFLLE